jgi:hypothetical protein
MAQLANALPVIAGSTDVKVLVFLFPVPGVRWTQVVC